MMDHYTCRVVLNVLGPFLTASTGPDRYGVDKSFHKDHAGRLIIPAAHVKGKLRMALEELSPFFEAAMQPDLQRLFGEKSASGTYEPRPGLLRFSNLVTEEATSSETRTRVTIDRASQTAAKNLLREVDNPFESGSEVRFAGAITFSASDHAAAQAIADLIKVGFTWLANLGSEKGVGFGRLRSVQIDAPEPVRPADRPGTSVEGQTLHLRIRALEPLLVGGVKSRRTNYVASRSELPGGLVKGALAAALIEASGRADRTLDARTAALYTGFEALVEHFSWIRVTHAFPAIAGKPRPVRRPISAVETDGGLAGDLALREDCCPLIGGNNPTYFSDAKAWVNYEGAAELQLTFDTRSEIDDASQRAAKGRLFTYGFLLPTDEEQRTIEWVCNVDMSGIEDERTRVLVAQQFGRAVQQHLHRLGKLGRQVVVQVGQDRAPVALPSRDVIENGLAVITLQTDTLMIAPDAARALPMGQDLSSLYAAYWADLSDNSLTLEDFFAHQGFEGGYRYHRYLGASERTDDPDNYRPYYLTRAGSVFRLRAADAGIARKVVERWLACGLPLPEWAKTEYGAEAWMNCPFVPENGYGEIAANLSWHWDRRL